MISKNEKIPVFDLLNITNQSWSERINNPNNNYWFWDADEEGIYAAYDYHSIPLDETILPELTYQYIKETKNKKYEDDLKEKSSQYNESWLYFLENIKIYAYIIPAIIFTYFEYQPHFSFKKSIFIFVILLFVSVTLYYSLYSIPFLKNKSFLKDKNNNPYTNDDNKIIFNKTDEIKMFPLDHFSPYGAMIPRSHLTVNWPYAMLSPGYVHYSGLDTLGLNKSLAHYLNTLEKKRSFLSRSDNNDFYKNISSPPNSFDMLTYYNLIEIIKSKIENKGLIVTDSYYYNFNKDENGKEVRRNMHDYIINLHRETYHKPDEELYAENININDVINDYLANGLSSPYKESFNVIEERISWAEQHNLLDNDYWNLHKI